MIDTAPAPALAPLAPDEPITAENFAQALAELAAKLPTDIKDLRPGDLWINGGYLCIV